MAATKYNLHTPSLEEIKQVLETHLKKNFQKASVDVVDCPDLGKEPFHLAAAGLCGNPCVADIGSVQYLFPTPQPNKIYDFNSVVKQCGVPNGFVIGCAAGPCHHVGVNAELIVNIKTGPQVNNKSLITKLKDGDDGTYVTEKVSSTECCILANLFISEGKPGKVLKVSAEGRLGEDDFVSMMQNALKDKYGSSQPVALGGAFLIGKGKANMHVMSDFSSEPLNSAEKIKSWFKFFEMSAPIVCLSEIVSHDPGWNLRTSHTHGFGVHGDGGHYHYDTTPSDVQYLGYFNVAQYLVRIDPPPPK